MKAPHCSVCQTAVTARNTWSKNYGTHENKISIFQWIVVWVVGEAGAESETVSDIEGSDSEPEVVGPDAAVVTGSEHFTYSVLSHLTIIERQFEFERRFETAHIDTRRGRQIYQSSNYYGSKYYVQLLMCKEDTID